MRCRCAKRRLQLVYRRMVGGALETLAKALGETEEAAVMKDA
jgi:hypothetical protein